MNNMKKIRESLQLTQVKVANDLKLSRQVYNFYENGKRNPSIKSLEKIINALDTNFGNFFKDM